MRKFSGRVVKGEGRAAGFVRIEWVQQQCRKNFGFYAYPGTLNLEISEKTREAIEKADQMQWIQFVPPDGSFCASQAMKININGVPGMVFRPESKKNIHKNNIIEVLSPLYLRHVLDLKDGDEVRFELQSPEKAIVNRKMKVKAVVFDLDGTLIDSIESYYRIVETALEKLGFPAADRSLIASAVKNEGFDWKIVLPDMDEEKLTFNRERAWKIIETLYPRMFLENVDIFPGADKIIEDLHSKGIRIALVTATPKKNMTSKLQILEKYRIPEKADVIICSDDTAYKKPYPDPLILCARKMALACSRCAYVGDVGGDIIAGKTAGMKTIGITTGFETCKDLLHHQPDAIIDDIRELAGIIF